MQTSSPYLSIIIPNYNHAKYLPDCIESIQKQTFTDYEIIIVDDNSQDESKQVIHKLAAKFGNIRPIFNTTNLRVSKTRDIGFRAARGAYVTNIDSDDVFFNTNKLKNEMALIHHYKEKHNKDIAAFSNIACVDKDLNYVKDQWPETFIKEGNILYNIIVRGCHIPRDFIFLKDVYYQLGGYDTRFNIYEDWDFKIRLSAMLEFYYTGEYGVGYRQLSGGLSQANTLVHIKNLNKIFNKNLGLIPRKDRKQIAREFLKMLDEKHIDRKFKGMKRFYYKWYVRM